MSTSVKLFLRTDYTSKEGCGIYIRLTINRIQKNFPLNKYVNPDFWTGTADKPIKKGWPNYEKLNFFLKQKLGDANTIVLDYELQKKPITFDIFSKEFCNGTNKESFYTFVYSELEEIKSKISDSYYDHALGYIKKMKEHKSELALGNFNYEFLSQYENYLIKLGNGQNTRYTNLKFFRMLLNRAVKKKIIKENPFKEFKISPGTSHREYLTIDELQKLEQLLDYSLPNYLKNVLIYFLFACYTSLRFSDIDSFDKYCIEGEMIRLTMKKTGEEVRIPFTQRIKILLETITDSGSGAFRVISNQKTNKYLKELISMVGINKSITFHCARHTFATIGLTIGIPIEVIGELLGHKNLKTTKIYAKIVDSLKIKSMQKWNDIPFLESPKPNL